jgi:molecular chaperone GrpE
MPSSPPPDDTTEDKPTQAENGEAAHAADTPDGVAAASPGAVPPGEPPELSPLEAARAEAARLKDQWMRVAADFDNFRKRTRRDIEDARKGGREELLKELLPVFDNLERAMQSAGRAQDVKAVSDGLGMVLKQFVDVLGRVGITKVKTVGSSFDPQVHEAIRQVETNEHPVGTVVAEVQPGYVHGERLVRAAMVVVAKPKSDVAPAEKPD